MGLKAGPCYELDGTKLRQYRRDQALLRTELAKRLGVSPQTLSRWELGQVVPGMATFMGIQAVLGVNAAAIGRKVGVDRRVGVRCH